MSNTKTRSKEIRDAARALLVARSVDVNEQVHILSLAKDLKTQTGCDISTAKKHVLMAVLHARGLISEARWGGARPGAGRPCVGKDDQAAITTVSRSTERCRPRRYR